MKKNYKHRWLEEDLEKMKKNIWITVGIHLFLLFILFLSGGLDSLASGRMLIIMAATLLIATLYFVYDFENRDINLLIVGSLLVLLFLEIFWLGLPSLSDMMSTPFMELGFLLDILLWMIPILYLFLRIMSIWPLIKIFKMQKKLSRTG